MIYFLIDSRAYLIQAGILFQVTVVIFFKGCSFFTICLYYLISFLFGSSIEIAEGLLAIFNYLIYLPSLQSSNLFQYIQFSLSDFFDSFELLLEKFLGFEVYYFFILLDLASYDVGWNLVILGFALKDGSAPLKLTFGEIKRLFCENCNCLPKLSLKLLFLSWSKLLTFILPLLDIIWIDFLS